MGVSGAGNFQDDRAYNYLFDVMERLQKDIEDCFSAHENGMLSLDTGNGTLMPSMDILITLSERYQAPLDMDAATVRKWKRDYLQLYDEQIDRYGPRPEYKEKRRVVIEETFTRLGEVCLDDSDEDEAD